ncbi:MAG TPA: hypothetical protein VFD32_07265, partial [Dehalococcoidia bacterium]|nr:hypothetical protein [Dehalococcoidia bacterium]
MAISVLPLRRSDVTPKRFQPGKRPFRLDLLDRVRHNADLERKLGVEEATRRFLLYVAVPLWLGAGLLDWWHHRRTRIEQTSGARESAIHALMMAEAGVPALLGLFVEVDAGMLLLTGAALAAHEATAIWDVSYAETRRRVTPAEQHVHSLLEVVPLMATSFLAVLHWDQLAALFGRGERPRFGLRPRRKPLSRRYVGGLLAALGACMALPYAEEFWRCFRTRRTLAPAPEPAQPPTETLQIVASGARRDGESGESAAIDAFTASAAAPHG